MLSNRARLAFTHLSTFLILTVLGGCMSYYDAQTNADTDAKSAPNISYLSSVSLPIDNYSPTATQIYVESGNFGHVQTLTDAKNLGWATDVRLWLHTVGDASTNFLHNYYMLSGLVWLGVNESRYGITIHSTSGDFPRTQRSFVDMTVHYSTDSNLRIKLYVAGELQALPDRPWIPGPFYVIRKAYIADNGSLSDDDVFAIWSVHLSWPVAGGGDVRKELSDSNSEYVVGYTEGGKTFGMSEGQMRNLAKSNPENLQIRAESAAQMAQANAAMWQAAGMLAGNIATLSRQEQTGRTIPSSSYVTPAQIYTATTSAPTQMALLAAGGAGAGAGAGADTRGYLPLSCVKAYSHRDATDPAFSHGGGFMAGYIENSCSESVEANWCDNAEKCGRSPASGLDTDNMWTIAAGAKFPADVVWVVGCHVNDTYKGGQCHH